MRALCVSHVGHPGPRTFPRRPARSSSTRRARATSGCPRCRSTSRCPRRPIRWCSARGGRSRTSTASTTTGARCPRWPRSSRSRCSGSRPPTRPRAGSRRARGSASTTSAGRWRRGRASPTACPRGTVWMRDGWDGPQPAHLGRGVPARRRGRRLRLLGRAGRVRRVGGGGACLIGRARCCSTSAAPSTPTGSPGRSASSASGTRRARPAPARRSIRSSTQPTTRWSARSRGTLSFEDTVRRLTAGLADALAVRRARRVIERVAGRFLADAHRHLRRNHATARASAVALSPRHRVQLLWQPRHRVQ